MVRLLEKQVSAQQALQRFSDVLREAKTTITRDAAIQRFEFTFEAVWKYAQFYLKTNEGIDLASPKAVIRACFQLGIFDEAQTELAIRMTDDRNLTSHTYDEQIAESIYQHFSDYYALLAYWVMRISHI
jgi:nucleotidyltransferase substrate binding protein (TIGR01987 family)